MSRRRTTASIPPGIAGRVSPAPGPNADRLYLFNPAVDLTVVASGLTFVLFPLSLLVSPAAGATAFLVLNVVCNFPHYMATNYRVYGSAAQRRRYRFFALHLTGLLLVVAVLSHLLPGPWVRALYTLYFTWSPYHYSGQNYGIALMYARRGGVDVTPGEKRLLYLACLASFLTYVVVINTALGSPDPRLLQLGVPLDVGRPLFLVLLAGGLASAAAFAWRLAARASRRVLLPVLLLVAAQFTWFSGLSAGVFFARELSFEWFNVQALLPALAFLHCAQYLGVTTYYAKREQTGEGGAFRPGHYFLMLVVGGLLLWPGTTRVFSLVFSLDYGLSFLVMASVINIHHFILDGAIWKLRDGRIARLLIAADDGPARAPAAPPPAVLRPSRALALALGAGDIASQLLVTRAGTLAQAGRWEDAGSAYATALRVNGSLADALNGLALSEMHRRRMPSALERWRESVRLNPLSAHARTGLGETYLKLGRLEDALAALEEARRLAPDDRAALLLLAMVHEARGEGGKAAPLRARVAVLDRGGAPGPRY